MVAKGTDKLSSKTLVIGRDSTNVATKDVRITFCRVELQSNSKHSSDVK